MLLAQRLQFSSDGVPAILAINHPNLVAMYTMDNISGSTLVNERIGNGDGTITGATQVAGKIGNALSFDGNDKVDISTAFPSTLPTSWAISYWSIGATGAQEKFSYRSASNDLVQMDAGGIVLIRGSSSTLHTLNTAADSAVNWVHWVLQYDSATTTLSLHGDDVLEDSIVANPGTISSTKAGLAHLTFTDSEFLIGKLDQFRYFDRSLTQLEITDLFNEGTP